MMEPSSGLEVTFQAFLCLPLYAPVWPHIDGHNQIKDFKYFVGVEGVSICSHLVHVIPLSSYWHVHCVQLHTN